MEYPICHWMQYKKLELAFLSQKGNAFRKEQHNFIYLSYQTRHSIQWRFKSVCYYFLPSHFWKCAVTIICLSIHLLYGQIASNFFSSKFKSGQYTRKCSRASEHFSLYCNASLAWIHHIPVISSWPLRF